MAAGVAITAGPANAQTASDVVYRANAGGSFTDDGNTWDALEDYQVAGEDETSNHGQPSSIDDSVPAGTPSQIWNTERWDPGDGEEMQYEFDVPDGQQVEVRLYFYDGFDGTSEVGDRVFDVSVEDQTIEEFDPIEEYGDDTGGMESFTVTSDGTIDVDFDHVTENPQINAIEIVSTEPQSDELGGPSNVDFGSVLSGESETETVTVTNLGDDGDSNIDISDVSVTGTDAGEFSAGSASDTTLEPGESADIPVTFSPSDVAAKSATLEIDHSGSNSPVTVDLSGEGVSAEAPGFSKSKLEGFSAGNPTAIDFGPDGRAYVSTQGGTVYALEVERTGENSYEVENEVEIDAIKDIPNHDDFGNLDAGEDNRQVTGLTAGGTADQPIVYVSSSDPTIDVGEDDDDTDTNSGAISRLTIDAGSDETLQESDVDHDVMVLGLPRSEENHATNGLDLTPDGDTLYVAQGGHTNKGAPGNNFGHTPEYALSAAVLEIDLAQIENNYQEKSLQDENSEYPDLDYLYALPTIQGGDLPFGGNDGINQAKLVEDGPVQIYSPGYRNPYDLVLAESGQLYVSDHGPNGGWGGQPADADGDITDDADEVTNHPNEDGSFTTSDQLVAADEGDYAGHAAPIRANPTNADIYDENGNVEFDITESNSPVPESMVDPRQADYIPPTSDSPDPGAPAGSAHTMEYEDGEKVLFSPTGGTEEYTASNFGGAMEGDLLQVELGGDVERIELSADGETVTNSETIFNTGGPLGIAAQGDDEAFAGTVWTANHGGNDVTVFEPNDYEDTGDGEQCTGADDPSLDEDGDGYDNADEIDAGSDPCSSGSTPPDFDDDGTSNVNDPDDDNDGIEDDEDLFAIDPDNGVDNELPATYNFAPNSESGTILDLGFTGVMTNGQNYQDLYDPDEVTAGGAANVLTVENVGQGDAHEGTNTQQHAYQVGVNADEPFTVETTVNGLPDDAEPFQSQGVFVGTGDQDNYAKLTATGFSDGDGSGVQLATEDDGDFTDVANPPAPTAGNETTLSMTVYPSNGTVEAYYAVDDGEMQLVDETTVPTSWFDTADGNGTAVGVISTSNGADSTFDATWQYLDVEPLQTVVSADAGADQTVDEGDEVTLDATGSTGESLSYSWTQVGDGPTVDLSDADTATPTFTPPDVDAETTLTFEVEVSDGEDTDTDEVNVEVQDTDATQPADGEVVHRVNAGGSELAALDDGPAWSADTDSDPSQFTNVEESGSSTYDTVDTIELDDSVPSSAPSSLFQTERWDPSATTGDEADAPEMEWNLPAQSGQTYEVRLYFAEIFLEEGNNLESQGPREFDVVLEGQTVLDDYNIHDQYGHDVGAMESFEVTPSDDDINVTFLHEQENPKISAIEIVAVDEDDEPDDEMTVEEAVASQHDPEDQIVLQDIQLAINWWATEEEVPDTGGETISLTETQQLINTWATGDTVGDGGDNTAPTIDPIGDQTVTEGDSATVPVNADDPDGDSVSLSLSQAPDFVSLADGEISIAPESGDAANSPYTVEVTADDGTTTTTESFQVTVEEPGAATGSAQVEITPDSGTEASTYTGGSFTVENTGDQEIESIEFDLSSAAMPDMVWDPDGTAGDQAAKGLVIDSNEDEVGVVSTADDDVFSQPHNGVNGSDGYDVLTIEFTDFEPDESVSFSADNDPTSIKDAQITSQEAGPVSGLELARSDVSVEYADGSVQETQLFGDGSEGGAQATLDESIAPAPSIDVEGVDLDEDALREHHSAAIVSEADQTVTVTGEPDETVTLLHHEAELELSNVPDYDGTPGYDIEEYEANKIENVDYQTVTLDSNGEATVDVTLLDSTDVGGYNYLVATQGEPDSDTGLDSNVVVLEFDESADDGGDDDGDTAFAVNAGGDAYTAADGREFQVDANFDGGETFTTGQSGTPSDPEIANTDDEELYYTERYGDFSYDVPLENGEYEVTLHFAEIFQGVANDNGEGDRLFDVSIEGQQVLDSYDIYAEAGGAHAATTETFTTEVTDGELNVDFSTVEDNAKVSAIEVEPADDEPANEPPTVDAGDDQSVEEGDSVTLDATNSDDPDGDDLSYEWTQTAGPEVTLSDEETATPSFTAPDVDADETLTFEVDVSDGQETDTDTVDVTVEDTDEPENQPPTIESIDDQTLTEGDSETVSVTADDPDGDSVSLSVSGPDFVSLSDGELTIAPQDGDAGTHPVEVTADDGTDQTTESFQLTVEEAETEPEVLHRVNAGESTTLDATDDGPDWTGVVNTDSEYLVSAADSGGNYCGGDDVTPTDSVPDSTPDAVYDCERYGNSTWAFDAPSGSEVEVRLYLSNQFPQASDPGDREYNVSVEDEQVLTNYDPVADVGHANGTVQTFTVTSDGTVDVDFEEGAAENPQVNAIEIVANPEDGSN